MRRTLLKILILCSFMLTTKLLVAQETSDPKQIWPELDAYYRLNERFRLYGLASGTRSNSEYTDGTASIFIDYFARPWLRGKKNETELSDTARGYYWWFRMGYSYSDAPASDKKKVVNIFETETDNNFRLPEKIVLTNRNRFDWRWVNGEFQPIYRPRLKFVRNFKTDYLTFDGYFWTEYFFYLNDPTQNRLRVCFGVEIKVLKFLDFETYYLYQYPNKQSVPSLNAIGIQINLYFSSKRYKTEMNR